MTKEEVTCGSNCCGSCCLFFALDIPRMVRVVRLYPKNVRKLYSLMLQAAYYVPYAGPFVSPFFNMSCFIQKQLRKSLRARFNLPVCRCEVVPKLERLSVFCSRNRIGAHAVLVTMTV